MFRHIYPSHVHLRSGNPGMVATKAKLLKKQKYCSIRDIYYFVPLDFATMGVFGDEAMSFITELSRRTKEETREAKARYSPCSNVCWWL